MRTRADLGAGRGFPLLIGGGVSGKGDVHVGGKAAPRGQKQEAGVGVSNCPKEVEAVPPAQGIGST